MRNDLALARPRSALHNVAVVFLILGLVVLVVLVAFAAVALFAFPAHAAVARAFLHFRYSSRVIRWMRWMCGYELEHRLDERATILRGKSRFGGLDSGL